MRKVIVISILTFLITPLAVYAQANKTTQEFVMPDGKTLKFESTGGQTVTEEEALKFYEALKKLDELREWERQHPFKGNSQSALDTPQQRPRVNYMSNSERAELARLQAYETAKHKAKATAYGSTNSTATFLPPPLPPPMPQKSVYVGPSGATYQYDLSKQEDRMRYSTDIPAQIRDGVYDPRRSIDGWHGARGGGINP